MKKFIIFLFLGFAFNISASSIDSTLKAIPDSSQVTFSKVYSDVKSGLDGLGSALKVGAEHVYIVLVRQQLVKSIVNLIILIISIIWITIVIKFLINYAKHGDTNEGFFFLLFCVGLVGGVIFIVEICNMSETVTGFINPEYGAIKEIIEFVK